MAEDLAPSRQQLRAVAADVRIVLDYVTGVKYPWDAQADTAVERLHAMFGADSWPWHGWPPQDSKQLQLACLSLKTLAATLNNPVWNRMVPEEAWRPAAQFLQIIDHFSASGPSGPPSWHLAPQTISAQASKPQEPFILGPRQKAIMDHLDRRAMRSRALAKALHIDQPSLYKRDGIKELMANGLVKNHRKIGYYRPDAPPAEYAEIIRTP